MLSACKIFLFHHLATAFAPELGHWGQPSPAPWLARKQITGSTPEDNKLGQEIGRRGREGEPAPNGPSGPALGCCSICALKKNKATWPN